MNQPLMKNLPVSEALTLADLVEIEDGRVVSRTLSQQPGCAITLFAFSAGEGISAHTSPGDALVQILEGEAAITIGETAMRLSAGQSVLMPAGVPHALEAPVPFKMLLVVVKPA